MEVVHLFPTSVSVFNFTRNLSEEENLCFQSALDDVESNTGNKITHNKQILDNSKLNELKQFLMNCIEQCLNETFEENTSLTITQSWLNITKNGEFHHIHTHPNSYLSGVFFIQTNLDDKIMFHKNTMRSMYYQPTFKESNPTNSSTWWLPATQNSLILFQSDVWHSVPTTENETRISLSFNTFFAKDFGETKSATKLVL